MPNMHREDTPESATSTPRASTMRRRWRVTSPSNLDRLAARRDSGTTPTTTRRSPTGCWTGSARHRRQPGDHDVRSGGRNGRFWAWEGAGLLPRHVRARVELRARHGPALPRAGALRARDAGLRRPASASTRTPARSASAARDARPGPATAQGGYDPEGAPRAPDVAPTTRSSSRNWPRIRKALEFLIRQDGNDDGLIEGAQHNTYDMDFYGPNTMVGSLYLGRAPGRRGDGPRAWATRRSPTGAGRSSRAGRKRPSQRSSTANTSSRRWT